MNTVPDINDQGSDTSSDINWPIDHPVERRQQLDRVVFENVADQYVKGEDVTAFFTILHDIKVTANEDQIGLLRVGSTNINECLAYAPVQFNPSATSGSTCHGTAIFPSSSLPVTDDEFYQFCYIIKKTKNLGSSIPFQLNCALDDIDLLSNAPVGRGKADGLIALADQDNDDIVVIHTKRMLTEDKLRRENRQLSEMNRRLESQRDECQAKLDFQDLKTKEHIQRIHHEMQTLTASHKTAIDELSSRQQCESNLRVQFNTCQSLCTKYQTDSLQHAERCRTFEDAHAQISNDTNQLRSQLAVTSQLAKDQATQIISLERHLMQSNELAKTSTQRQTTIEQQMRDLRLTSEKHQLSLEGQLNAYTKQITEQTDQIQALETENILLNDEMASVNADNERLLAMSNREKDLREEMQQQLDLLRVENESTKNAMETLHHQLEEINSIQQAYTTLNNSFNEIKKRCVKHQKSEIEVKRQLGVYQQFINDLQRESQDLTERLAAGAEEYKTLFRKYTMLEHSTQMTDPQDKPKAVTTVATELVNNEVELVSGLYNTYENQLKQNEEEKLPSLRASLADIDVEIRECPMCYWEFPAQMALDAKREHIDHHFA